MMISHKIAWSLALSSCLATACTEPQTWIDPEPELRPIRFTPRMAAHPKAGYLDPTGGFVLGDVIGVFGYQTSAPAWSNTELPTLMYNITLSKQAFDTGSGTVINYVYNPQSLWPETGRVRFFAYYPHNSSVGAGSIIPSSPTYSGVPFVEVTLGLSDTPIDFVTAQTPLMSKADGVASGGVTLEFAHRLAKLMFKVKAAGLDNGLDLDKETRKMYINQLRIKNIYNKAKYTFDDAAQGTWTDHTLQGVDASSGATIAAHSVMAAIGQNDYQDLIDPHGAGSYLLMIPQRYDNVVFEVTYTIERLNVEGGCEDRTVVTKQFPASIDWQSGQVYTYYLEFGFAELDEGDIALRLTVKNWTSGGYGVTMGD